MSGNPRIIRWEQPPPRTRASGRLDWQPVAEELRRHPGRWALVWECSRRDADERRARGLSSGITTATLTAFRPAGSFNSSTRMSDSDVKVYAVYLGDEPAESDDDPRRSPRSVL